MPVALRGKYQYDTQADLTKLRGYCKNVEITPLKEAVADYVRNYLVPDRRLGGEAAAPTAAPAAALPRFSGRGTSKDRRTYPIQNRECLGPSSLPWGTTPAARNLRALF